MNKKIVGAAAVAAVLLAYGGTTWYLGSKTQQSYEEALTTVQDFLGPQAVLSHEYQRGFFTSKAKLALQWRPAAQKGGANGASGTPAPQAVRIVVNSALRHGPIVGTRLAAAVVESHFSVEGLDAAAQQAMAKVTAPTLTTVHALAGGHDVDLALPAGEVGDGTQWLRWKALTYQMHVNDSGRNIRGSFAWPEVSLSADKPPAGGEQGDGDEENGPDREPAGGPKSPAERFTLAMQGMDGSFDTQLEDGLWLLSPGTGKGRFGSIVATHVVGDAPTQTLLALEAMDYSVAIARTGTTLGWQTKAQTKGRVGPLVFDAVTMEETLSRIDVEAVKIFQKAVFAMYRNAAMQPENVDAAQELALLGPAAPLLVAALPAYSMKLSASLDGQQATLEYGAEVKTAPSADEVQRSGWGPALLKGSIVHANLRLPKVWLPRIAQAVTQRDMPAEQIDSMVGMAEARGFVRQDGEQLSSALRLEGGALQVNGKPIALPGFSPPQN